MADKLDRDPEQEEMGQTNDDGVSGTFTDSLKAYRHDSVGFAEMGLVRVGELRGTRSNRRASMESLNMWNGSLTRITSCA